MIVRNLCISLSMLASVAAVSGCSDSPPAEPADGKAAKTGDLTLSDVQTSVAERTKKIADYAYSGTATTLDGGESVAFSYRLKQPGMLRADIAGIDQSYIFDGQHLAVIDRANKRVLKRTFNKGGDSKGSEDGLAVVTALHQFFGDYACAGWKPPLLRTKAGQNSATLTKLPSGERVWVLTTLLDDADLKEVRYTLRFPQADFLKKEWIKKDGGLWASTEVVEEHRDERTKLRFPKVWEHKGPQRKFRVEIKDIEINQGLSPELFIVTAPEGFTVQEVGG
jgi:outer membrane lipoprotein-sorting protein